MRTALELDDDALEPARSLAHAPRQYRGTSYSELVRLALRHQKIEMRMRNGVPFFVPNQVAQRPDLALANAGRDE